MRIALLSVVVYEIRNFEFCFKFFSPIIDESVQLPNVIEETRHSGTSCLRHHRIPIRLRRFQIGRADTKRMEADQEEQSTGLEDQVT